MNLDAYCILPLAKERKRIINELEAHGIVFTSLTEPEISALNIEKEVVVLENWQGSLVSTPRQLDISGMST